MISPEGLAALIYPALILTCLSPVALIAFVIKDVKEQKLW